MWYITAGLTPQETQTRWSLEWRAIHGYGQLRSAGCSIGPGVIGASGTRLGLVELQAYEGKSDALPGMRDG
jgi:hypothetical protein